MYCTGSKDGTGAWDRSQSWAYFPVDNLRLPLVAPVSIAAVSSTPSLALWHTQLGHASSSRIQQLAFIGLLDSVSTENFDCVSCQLEKQPALPFNSS